MIDSLEVSHLWARGAAGYYAAVTATPTTVAGAAANDDDDTGVIVTETEKNAAAYSLKKERGISRGVEVEDEEEKPGWG